MPKAVTIRKVEGKPGQVYYPLELIDVPKPTPSATQLLIALSAASLNHRDFFIRQHLYPGTAFNVPLLADGCGVVISTGSSPSAKLWLNKRVILNPGYGWKDSPEGPEDAAGYRTLGGTKFDERGTLQEFVCVEAEEVEEAPGHLSDVEAAALPLTGLTGWRALVSKSGNAVEGRNILVTGIGGGVALMVLMFAVQMGCNVFVTSGNEEKLKRAEEFGAKGGVIYKEEGWEKKLKAMLPEGRKSVDAIIDGAGGDVVDKGARVLKVGGVIVSYGMTTGPKMPYSMTAVLKNIELKGSTMGSRKEFNEMVEFVGSTSMKPVVSRIVKGLENMEGIDSLFDDMKKGTQFGKLVVEISKDGQQSKL